MKNKPPKKKQLHPPSPGKPTAKKDTNIVPVLKVVLSLLAAFILWHYIFSETPKLVENLKTTGFRFTLRAILIVISVAFLLYSFLFFFKLEMSSRKKNVGLVLYSTMIFFLSFEIIFMYLPLSQGSDQAYCAKLWFKKYWKVNQSGYRDAAYDPATDSLKKKIIFIGDSYAAGHGLTNIKERMSNILGNKIGHDYRVFNLGRNGINTVDEFQGLQMFPYRFDKLIWIHVPNDLDYLVSPEEQARNNNMPQIAPNIFQKGFAVMISESFFINFLSYTTIGQVFMSFFQPSQGQSPAEEEYPFSNTAKLDMHLANIKRIDSTNKIYHVKWLFVSFPFPGQNDPKALVYYNKFIDKLKENHINYLDALPICNQLSLRKQIISPLDQHPSAEVNRLVADSIYSRLLREGWFNE